MRTIRLLAVSFIVAMLGKAVTVSAAAGLVIPVGVSAPVLKVDGDTGGLSFSGDTAVWNAEAGDRVLFAFPLPAGVKFEDYGLCEFDAKIEGGPAEVMFFAERPGERRRVWRAVEIHVQPEGWQRLHIDLAQPEIVRESHFKAKSPRIAFNLWAFESGYPEIGRKRTISIRNVRLLPRCLDVVWNGFECRSPKDPSGDLVYEYPIVVRNRDRVVRTVESRIRWLPDTYSAAVIPESPGSDRAAGFLGGGVISPKSAVLAPGDSARFTVTLRLPKKTLASLKPFACEWYLPVFTLKGEPDMEEGILRSRNRIPLPLIVMPDADPSLAVLGPDGLRGVRERYDRTDWGKKEGDALIAQARQLLKGEIPLPNGPGWAAAYYYCEEHRCSLQYQGTGKHFCPVGKEYRDKDFEGVDLERDHRTSDHEAAARNSRTFALAYLLTGEEPFARASLRILEHYRAHYFTWDWMDLDTSRDTIDKGRMEFAKYMETYCFRAMVEALEFLKMSGGVDSAEARRLERELLLPAIVEITDYRMDLLCRQTSMTILSLAGGIAFENAPLTAFAVASPFGYYSMLRWGSTADGICHGHGYAQNHYAINLLSLAEIMDRCGLDVFDADLKRVVDGSFWWSEPMNPAVAADLCTIAVRHWPDPAYRLSTRRSLLDGEPPPARGNTMNIDTPPTVNFPSSGLSILRRPAAGGGTHDAVFRWGLTDNRGEFAMLSVELNTPGYRAQNYPGHFAWGSTDLHHEWQIQTASHTTVVVDARNHSGMKDYFKGHYEPHPSRQTFFEEGPLGTAALAENGRIAPGVRMLRAVCVLDGAYFIADILRSDAPHTYDWWFHGVPDHTNGREGIHAVLKPRPAPLGTTDGYEMVRDLSSGQVSGDLTCEWTVSGAEGRPVTAVNALVLNKAPLEAVHGFEWSYQYSTQEKEFLVLRREKASDADFLVLVEPHAGASRIAGAERFTVMTPAGRPAVNAFGVRFRLGGKPLEIIVNPDGAEVKTTAGTSRKRIAIAEITR